MENSALIQWTSHLSAGMAGGLRAAGPKADIALVAADEPCVAAGVFTLNVMCAAPVTYCKQVLAKGQPVKAVSRVPTRPQTVGDKFCPASHYTLPRSEKVSKPPRAAGDLPPRGCPCRGVPAVGCHCPFHSAHEHYYDASGCLNRHSSRRSRQRPCAQWKLDNQHP